MEWTNKTRKHRKVVPRRSRAGSKPHTGTRMNILIPAENAGIGRRATAPGANSLPATLPSAT